MQTTDDANNFFRADADFAISDAREKKAQRTKTWGEPIELPGKVIRMTIMGDNAWIADSGAVVRRVDLETGKSLQVFKGHTGPVTCIEFYPPSQSIPSFLFSGSWDTMIRVWDIQTRTMLSATKAHNDFVKSLLVIPALNILVSGSSDKTVRIWDLEPLATNPTEPLVQLGSLSAHTRPVEWLAIDPDEANPSAPTLYTADSMGVIKVWKLDRENGSCRGALQTELKGHSTGITQFWVRNGSVWSASLDKSVLLQFYPETSTPPILYSIPHDTVVKSLLPLPLTALSQPYLLTGSGDKILVYDVTSFGEKDGEVTLVSVMDAHWHDVTAIGLWIRKVVDNNKQKKELWIATGSLDGTIRRWKFDDLLSSKPPPEDTSLKSVLTEEEERELEELMNEC